MSTQTFSVGVCASFALVACAPESGAPEGDSVECALAGSQRFASDCVLETLPGDAFAIHGPDGSFQRFSYDEASGVLTVADGAEGIAVDPDAPADSIEFAVGANRYRISLENLTSPSK